MLGSFIAYHISKKYGYKALHAIFTPEVVDSIHKIHIKKDREFESAFILLITLGSMSEALAYAAPIIGIKLHHFMIARFITHILFSIVLFLAADYILDGKFQVLFALPAFALILYVLYKVKGRYFE